MSRIRSVLVAILAMGLLVMSVGVARADNLQQTTLSSPVNTATVGVGDGAPITFQLTANNGDGQTGCNASDASPAVVTFSSSPAGVIVSPSPVSFNACHNGASGTNDPVNDRVVNFSANVPGVYSITASVADSGSSDISKAYNTNPAAFTLNVTAPPAPVDTTPPVITVPADITKEATGPDGAVVSFSASAVDAVDGPRPVTCTPSSGSTFPLGETTVTCTASDTRGNSDSKSFKITVVDTTPPEFNDLSDVTAYGWNGFFQPIDNGNVVNKAKAGQSIPVKFSLTGPANVNYTVSATDIVDQDVEVTCDIPSGSQFQQGTTTVTCTATDDSNNSTADSFDVNVVGGNLGLNILWQGYPGFAFGTVPPADAADAVEVYSSSVPGLTYDAVADQYVYVWKTDKAWAGTSGTLKVKLADGGVHTALFSFTK